jgi:hypothetical protein
MQSSSIPKPFENVRTYSPLFNLGFLAGFSGGIALSLALVTAFPVPLGRYPSWRISPHLSRKIGYGSEPPMLLRRPAAE